MSDKFTRSAGGAPYSMLCTGIGCAALALMLASCNAGLPAQRDAERGPSGSPAPPYSLVFVIHGDGDYTYHDTSGTERTADEEALAEARRIAERNPLAEVFIFHQIPRKHVLFFFPVHDGEFYYYRNGLLRASASYWRNEGQSRLEAEAGLYRSLRGSEDGGGTRLFVYCGHEIPEWPAPGYDASQPGRTFSVDDLAAGLKAFRGDSARFDLTILSTCFGGTPHSIAALAVHSRRIIASPDNLHLSYFDLRPLERLDIGLLGGDVRAFAERIAGRSFEKLTRDVQTAVSVCLYDADSVQEYLHSVQGAYDSTLNTLQGMKEAFPAEAERCDCAALPAYLLPAMNRGVEVFYRAARFGRSRLTPGHSGWECWKEKSGQGTASLAPGPILK